MKLPAILNAVKFLGRGALVAGGAGTAFTFGSGDAVELMAELTLFIGALTEGAVRIIRAWAIANGKVPPDVTL